MRDTVMKEAEDIIKALVEAKEMLNTAPLNRKPQDVLIYDPILNKTVKPSESKWFQRQVDSIFIDSIINNPRLTKSKPKGIGPIEGLLKELKDNGKD